MIEMPRGITSNEWVSELQALPVTRLLLEERLSLCLLMEFMLIWINRPSSPLTLLKLTMTATKKNSMVGQDHHLLLVKGHTKSLCSTTEALCETLVWLTFRYCAGSGSASLTPPHFVNSRTTPFVFTDSSSFLSSFWLLEECKGGENPFQVLHRISKFKSQNLVEDKALPSSMCLGKLLNLCKPTFHSFK